MTNEELTKYSGEHLLYEITIFWWLSGAIWYTDGYMHESVRRVWRSDRQLGRDAECVPVQRRAGKLNGKDTI